MPKKLPKVKSLCGNISTWSILLWPSHEHSIQSQTYPNFTALRSLGGIQCLQQLFHRCAGSDLGITVTAPLTAYRGVASAVALSTSFCSAPASHAPTTFTATHILLSAAYFMHSEQVAHHSHSSSNIEAFNMVPDIWSAAKFLGDNMKWRQWRAIHR